MASLNKVLIIGNLGRDPETRFATEGGLQITTINVATSRSYRSQASGQLVEETEWHRIVFFGKQAETIQKYLRKGSSVYVEGRLRTRKWEKDGVTHYATEIMGENFQFLDRRSDSAGSSYPADSYSSEPAFNTPQYGARPAPSQGFEKPVSQAPAYQQPTPGYQQPSYNRPAQQAPAAPQSAPNSDPFGAEDEDIPF